MRGRFCSSVQVRGAACNQFWCGLVATVARPGRASLSPLSPELAVALLTSVVTLLLCTGSQHRCHTACNLPVVIVARVKQNARAIAGDIIN